MDGSVVPYPVATVVDVASTVVVALFVMGLPITSDLVGLLFVVVAVESVWEYGGNVDGSVDGLVVVASSGSLSSGTNSSCPISGNVDISASSRIFAGSPGSIGALSSGST